MTLPSFSSDEFATPSESCQEFALNVAYAPGHHCSGWICTPFDSWERCPVCPNTCPGGHPEADLPYEGEMDYVPEEAPSSVELVHNYLCGLHPEVDDIPF